MTKTDKTGGPAFPTPAEGESTSGRVLNYEGMTLRDWFAGQAPEPPEWWLLAKECPTPPPGWKEGDGVIAWQQRERDWRLDRLVSWRWFYADAMIAARSKGGDT